MEYMDKDTITYEELYRKEGYDGIEDTDFIGFTYNGIHSSSLNIVRVENGEGLEDSLSPEIKANTISIPQRDGQIFIGSNYDVRNFTISFAFDEVTEKNLRDIRNWFSQKKKHDLIFDEAPYKAYSVIPTSPPTLNYMCFEEEGQRVYKGTGSVTFICYDVYGKCKGARRFLDYYKSKKISNIDQWKDAAGLIDNSIAADLADNSIIDGEACYNKEYLHKEETGLVYYVFNPGDAPADFTFQVGFHTDKTIPAFTLRLKQKQETGDYETLEKIALKKISKQNSSKDWGICIDTKNELIEGIDENGKLTGTIYNEYINETESSFFQIPVNSGKYPYYFLYSSSLMDAQNDNKTNTEIDYSYLYL